MLRYGYYTHRGLAQQERVWKAIISVPLWFPIAIVYAGFEFSASQEEKEKETAVKFKANRVYMPWPEPLARIFCHHVAEYEGTCMEQSDYLMQVEEVGGARRVFRVPVCKKHAMVKGEES